MAKAKAAKAVKYYGTGRRKICKVNVVKEMNHSGVFQIHVSNKSSKLQATAELLAVIKIKSVIICI